MYARTIQTTSEGLLAVTAATNISRNALNQRVSEQSSFLIALNNSHIAYQEIFRTQRVLNGIAVRLAPADTIKVSALPGVERVELLAIHTLDNSASVPFINAPQLWGASAAPLNLPFNVTGTGIKIGIIDTGIDYQHPDFGGTGLLADYQLNDTTTITDTINGNPLFPTPKVVGGFDFAGNTYSGGDSLPTPDKDPMDCNGHGTHVAGTAAGVGVDNTGNAYAGGYFPLPNYGNLRIGPGVAPSASLYALRVFGCNGGTTLITQAIEWATDPNGDGDFSDRLDVINMSLGASYGSASSPEAIAADNATLTGMIVVASAGNSGDTFFIQSSPASGKHVISVSASADPSVSSAMINITAPQAIAGTYLANTDNITIVNSNDPQPPPLSGQTAEVVLINDGSTSGSTGTIADACQTPFINASAVAGKFALVDFGGSCDRAVKAQNVQANGGIGMVLINKPVGILNPFALAKFLYTPVGAPVSIPSLMISEPVGRMIKTQLLTSPVTVVMQPANAADTLASFSSRGPQGDGNTISLKPDLTAPGVFIPSANRGITAVDFNPGGQRAFSSGTSMAAPHVTGLMALLREKHPTLSVDELKALAMNTAAHNVTLAPNANPPAFPASSVGAGRIDAARAASGKILAYNNNDPGAVSITFNAEPLGITTATQSIELKNLTNVPQNVTVSMNTLLDSPGVSFSIVGNPALTVPANGSVLVNVQMSADTSQMKRFRDPNMSSHPFLNGGPTSLAAFNTTPRHYLAEESALVKISQGGNELARLPIYMAYRPHSAVLAPANVGFGKPANGTVNLPISGQSFCTGTLSPGPTCNGNFATTDQKSLVSPFELQFKNPPTPTLPGFANIRYFGVNFDPVKKLFLFGIATYGKWSTPSQVAFNVCVDIDNDGRFDATVFHSDPGFLAALSGNGFARRQDMFINATTFNGVDYLTGGAASFVNLIDAGTADTALFDNNVMILGATTTQLSLPDDVTRIKYGIAVCPGEDPFCVAANLSSTQCTGADALAHFDGPFTYDAAHPAVDTTVNGTTSPILFEDLNGATIPVTYNTANLVANGSLGMLLLHHHNTSDKTAQVVLIDQIFADGFGKN